MITIAKILDKERLLLEAGKRGEIKFIKWDEARRTNRFMVFLDHLAVPVDVTDEAWENLVNGQH